VADQSVGRFIVRRVAIAVPLLIVITFAVFALIHLAPGSPERALLGTKPATPETLAAIRARWNLDKPFLVQYLLWLKAVAVGDLGRSIQSNQTVTAAIGSRIGLTIFLGAYAVLIAVGLGIPLGLWAALRRGTRTDRTVVGVSVLGVSAPTFATGLLFIFLFGVVLDWFPTFGGGHGFVDRAWHLTLPALAVGLSLLALIVKITRAAVIDELDQDYVAFARARGLPQRRIMGRYVMRNALIPIVTAAGLIVVGLFGGAVLIEVTFGLQGLGTLLVESVRDRDVPLVQGLVLITAVFVIVVNLGLDVLYTVIDPRIRFSKAES
jgi:peptide/nickel transport system permease protein